MRILKTLILLTLFIGCRSARMVFENQSVFTFEDFKLDKAVGIENKLNSKDVSLDYRVGLGKGLYPNEKDFKLEISKNFRRNITGKLSLEVDYHFTNDSIIRFVMYEWDDTDKKSFPSKKEQKRKYKIFESKFSEIAKIVTTRFGDPYSTIIRPKENKTSEYERDEIKWKTKNGMNAYLFSFNNNEEYSRIRLALYKE